MRRILEDLGKGDEYDQTTLYEILKEEIKTRKLKLIKYRMNVEK